MDVEKIIKALIEALEDQYKIKITIESIKKKEDVA